MWLPSMKKKTVDIAVNLLPEDPFFETIVGRTMRWAVSVGRYIVIFTELLVIISFGTRFSLDRQITDLNDAIHQKASIIKSFGDLENTIKSVQGRIEDYQQLQQRKNLADMFPAISAITPQDVKLTELVIKPTAITMRGTTQSQTSLNLLINNIQLSPQFFNVKVNSIETSTETQGEIVFEMSADTEKNPKSIIKATTPATPAPTSPGSAPKP